MITKWKLFNFKSIREETDLEFGPLTIFAGSNSSGKSTVLQSILLVSQTMASKVRSRSVILNGPLVKLGQFDDLRSFDSNAQQILVGWECIPEWTGSIYRYEPAVDSSINRRWPLRREKIDSIIFEVSFDASTGINQDIAQLQPILFGCNLSCKLRPRPNEEPIQSRILVSQAKEARQKKTKQVELQKPDERILEGLDFDVNLYPDQTKEDGLVPKKLIGCLLEHFIPKQLVERYDVYEEYARAITEITYGLMPHRNRTIDLDRDFEIPSSVFQLLDKNFGTILNPHLKDNLSSFSSITIWEYYDKIRPVRPNLRAKLREEISEQNNNLISLIRDLLVAEKEPQYALDVRPLPDELSVSASYLEDFFATGIQYLGPLRDDPKPLYPLTTNTDPRDIGLRGEHTAAVLDLHRERLIYYLPTINFENPAFKQEKTTRSLEKAVLDWLQYMGVAERLETHDRGKLGHELKITTPGTKHVHDLTHVGVGVSQVLPILVMCLLAEQNATLIIEQPELHLHPKVQTFLGDFFLSMALLGKQIVVETHSEYIINRLRFRAAAAKDDRIANQLKIYFAEKKAGASHFREVNVNQYGAIMDWPEGFFDQSQSEAEEILRAATRKRKLAREKGRNAQRND